MAARANIEGLPEWELQGIGHSVGAETAIFESCVRNPPGYEGGSEHGLTNALEAIKRHLPRQANAPDKIRPNANLAIIIATDELPRTRMSEMVLSAGNLIPGCFLLSTLRSFRAPHPRLFLSATIKSTMAAGVRLGLVLRHVGGRRHLPVVEVKQAA